MDLRRKFTPDIGTLQAFECAARHRSFTRAGLELNLTQSAISRQIKELEHQIGSPLFERIRREVVLSEAGRRFLPEVKRFLQQSEHLMLRASASAGAQSVLSVASLPTFGSRWLTPRLPDFLASHEGTVVNVGSRSEPFDFEQEPFDLAIHYGQPVWPRAKCTFLCSEVVVPVASPQLLPRRLAAKPAALVDQPLLHLATRPMLWADWFSQNGQELASPYRGHRFDQFAMLIEAAARGLGVALLPLYLIEPELASGRLEILMDRPIATDSSYYVVLPEGKQDNVLAKAFQAWLLRQVKGRRTGSSNRQGITRV